MTNKSTITNIASIDDVYELLKSDKYNLDTKISWMHPTKTNGKYKNMSLGRIWFNLLLPEDYPLVDEPVTKDKLDNIVKDLYKKYKNKATEYITKMQDEAFKLAAIAPSTFNVEMFEMSNELKRRKQQFIDNIDNMSIEQIQKEAQNIVKDYLKELQEKNIPIRYILENRVKGNPLDDIRNLLITKGFAIDIEGNILGPFKHGIADGYDKQEYAWAGNEARRNFYYKSSMTAIPGYLARKITVSTANVQITSHDCKTNKYFELAVDENIAKTIHGRYIYENGKVKPIGNPDKYIGKKIKLRSPLYCKDPDGICEICYGDLAKGLNTKNVGILAGGAINGVALNALMKLRHKPTSIDIIDVDFIEVAKKFGAYDQLVKYFDIQTKSIRPLVECVVTIDLNEYNEDEYIETSEYLLVPGIIDVYIPSEKKFVTLPYNFNVKLYYPTDYQKEKKQLVLKYEPKELMIEQDKITKEIDPRLLDRLFNASMKYIKTPEQLVLIIAEELKYAVDLVHIETIVQNMFRDAFDLTKPARLTDYKNFEIVGVKKLPFVNGGINGLIFENIDRAIKVALLDDKNKQTKFNPLEKLVLDIGVDNATE